MMREYGFYRRWNFLMDAKGGRDIRINRRRERMKRRAKYAAPPYYLEGLLNKDYGIIEEMEGI